MSNSNSTIVPSGGVSFTGLLTLLFIGLKLGHVITWSWLWVLSPLWISALLFTVGFVVVFVCIVVAAYLTGT